MFFHPLVFLKNNSLLENSFILNFIIGLSATQFKIMAVEESKEILKQNVLILLYFSTEASGGIFPKVSHPKYSTFIQD